MSFIKAVFNLILPEIELIKLSIFLFFMLRVIHRIVSISSKILQKKVSFPQKVLKSAVKSVILASFLYFWEKVVEKSTSDNISSIILFFRKNNDKNSKINWVIVKYGFLLLNMFIYVLYKVTYITVEIYFYIFFLFSYWGKHDYIWYFEVVFSHKFDIFIYFFSISF